MTISGKIEKKIAKIPEGITFRFLDMGVMPNEYAAATKALERLANKGIIVRASTGLYYKPEQTVFGTLKPAEEELLKTYLFQDGKRIAYITGPTLYNRLMLTTQVPKNIQVASLNKRVITEIGSIKVKAVKSYVAVNDDNYKILGLLDAIKDFRDIPDRDTKGALIRLRQLLKDLKNADLQKLVKTSLSYPPRVRALTGALLDWNRANDHLIESLAKSLNPLSTYNFAIPESILPVANKWRIE